jgi:hypothetical protein
VSPDDSVVVEVFGEGRTDVGHDPRSQRPTRGVVPILLHRLCGKPGTMFVKRYGIPFLQQKTTGRGLHNKVTAARKLAHRNKSHAVVFVMDSEGDLEGRREELAKGREAGPASPPMAVGIAHPCIEAWLLCDAAAIRRALGLSVTPTVPDKPEELPAPRHDSKRNPKTQLAQVAGATRQDLSADEKDRIAAAMNDMQLPRTRCPLGFAPFADEVENRIRPLF